MSSAIIGSNSISHTSPAHDLPEPGGPSTVMKSEGEWMRPSRYLALSFEARHDMLNSTEK